MMADDLIVLHQIELIHGLVGDRRRDNDAITDIDFDVSGRLTLLHTDDPTHELVARADLPHGIPRYPTLP
jgi:hypothetical protein